MKAQKIVAPVGTVHQTKDSLH